MTQRKSTSTLQSGATSGRAVLTRRANAASACRSWSRRVRHVRSHVGAGETSPRRSRIACRQRVPSERRPDMGTVHRLIEEKGKAGALRANLDRRIVEAAAQYMANEEP